MVEARLEERTERFVPQISQEAGGSSHAGPLQARTRRLPRSLRRVLRSRVVQLATTPHGVDPYLRMVNPLWSLETTRALLVDIFLPIGLAVPKALLARADHVIQ